MAFIVELVPDGYRFIAEATVGEGDHYRSSSPEHLPDLAEPLNRPHQLVYSDAAPSSADHPVHQRQL